jgi:acyl-CoA synthetase (AMP-forming)/AMP-acid ligase II
MMSRTEAPSSFGPGRTRVEPAIGAAKANDQPFSGTTGDPKGVLYSHRSNLLHALANNAADGLALKAADVR